MADLDFSKQQLRHVKPLKGDVYNYEIQCVLRVKAKSAQHALRLAVAVTKAISRRPGLWLVIRIWK